MDHIELAKNANLKLDYYLEIVDKTKKFLNRLTDDVVELKSDMKEVKLLLEVVTEYIINKGKK